jgi:hypothetical protein
MSDLKGRIRRLEHQLGVTRSSDPKERPVGERVLLICQGPGMTEADAVTRYIERSSDPAMLGPGADAARPETWYPAEARRPKIITVVTHIPRPVRPRESPPTLTQLRLGGRPDPRVSREDS